MALGGGTFVTQNKVLPGTYINFKAAARSTTETGGIAAVPIELDWFADGKVVPVTAERYVQDCKQIFGYDMTDDALKNVREVFCNAETVLFYRLNSGGIAASNTYATAKNTGTRGNALSIVIAANVDNESKFDVSTLLDYTKVDMQTVERAAELEDNAYVTFNKTGASLEATAGVPLTGGTNGTVNGAAHQAALTAFEPYTFTALACPSTDEAIKKMYAAFTERQRDYSSQKFQCIVSQHAADYEGIISIANQPTDGKAADLVYWTTGAAAAAYTSGKSLTNTVYTGEYTVDTSKTQTELTTALQLGSFLFHLVGDEVRVLRDINTLCTYTAEKSADFAENQVIRTLDRIAVETANEYNTNWLGKAQNNATNRLGFRAWIVKHRTALANRGLIEEYNTDELTVAQGDSKRSIVVTEGITPVTAMDTLYLTTTVS